tara:strand:- start:1588 stop:2016 length:429 start_codon:yes stop_codon:yes gene_type:complete
MNTERQRRLTTIIFLLVGVSLAVTLILQALNQNKIGFYLPNDILSGKAPIGKQIRAGGMVLEGSLKRTPGTLALEFILTDHAGATFIVKYVGILPDLFREGQGIVVRGMLNDDSVFEALEVLAKHDENYMPRELSSLADKNK